MRNIFGLNRRSKKKVARGLGGKVSAPNFLKDFTICTRMYFSRQKALPAVLEKCFMAGIWLFTSRMAIYCKRTGSFY